MDCFACKYVRQFFFEQQSMHTDFLMTSCVDN